MWSRDWISFNIFNFSNKKNHAKVIIIKKNELLKYFVDRNYLFG
jgi:hypothetical protein